MDFTLMEELWFGEGDEEQVERAAAASLVAQLGVLNELRPFPVSAQRLMVLAQDSDAKVAHLEKVIESDPILATKVMRMVNSAAFGLRRECRSVSHAVVLLGLSNLSQIAAAMVVLEMFDGSGKMATIREHCVAVGSVMRRLGARVGVRPGEDFTCGLLHDLGKMMMLLADRELAGSGGLTAYEPRLAECEGFDSLHLVEREVYGYDHAVLAAHMLRTWKIPEPIPVVVAKHHQPGAAYKQASDVAAMIGLLRLADRAVHLLVANTDDETAVAEMSASGEAKQLDIDEGVMMSIWAEVAAACQESRSLLAA